MTTNMTIIKQLQAQGERMTMPRRLVIEALGQAHEHLTISDIQQRIQEDSHNHLLSDIILL
jgi:Fe2+ or Zn2+ uptake regulation protein